MSTSFLLQGKHAVVFGGGGSIGTAVAKEFASQGAEVFLAGRTAASVEAVAKQIEAAGGRAHADIVDALDSAAVEEYCNSVVQQTGSLDIEFNATGPRVSEYANGKPVGDLPVEEFMVPVETVLKANFITASAAARHMLRQGSGRHHLPDGQPGAAAHPGQCIHRCGLRRHREPHAAYGDRPQSRRREGGLRTDLRESRTRARSGT